MSSNHSKDELFQVVRDVWSEHDPVPEGLVARMQVAVTAELEVAATDLDAELMRLVSRESELAGARGTAAYTLRFSSGETDLLVRAVETGEGTARLDGWVSPPRVAQVTATTVPENGAAWTVTSDDTGRFEFTDLPTGMVRLHLMPDDASGEPFGTPAFEI